MIRCGLLAASNVYRQSPQWIKISRANASNYRKKGQQTKKSSPPTAQNEIIQIRPHSTSNIDTTPPFRSSSSTSFPYTPPPSRPPTAEKSNTLRNVLLGVLVAAVSLSGAYFSGVFEPPTDTSKAKVEENKKKKKWLVRKYPVKKDDFPAKIPYLLIGGGTASFTAFRAIKSKEPTAKVLVISAEDSAPYMRPPLSKEIWQLKELPDEIEKLSFKQWNGQNRSVFYEPNEFYHDIKDLASAENGGVSIAKGWVVSKIDAPTNTAFIEDPESGTVFPIQYEKCLIATGSEPKKLQLFERAPAAVREKIVSYRNIRDFQHLWQKLENANSVTIIGGGFLGSELACSLGRKFKESNKGNVYQCFKEPGNMGKVLPEYLSKWTTQRVIEEGVQVLPQVEVKDVKMDNNKVSLILSNGDRVKSDIVIVAVGSEPCTQLAESSFLEVDPVTGGFLVNAELEARSNVYVAGDVACFYDPILGRRRVEHHDNAVVTGRLAGENMVGAAKAYKHQSMFWSDLGPDVAYEAVGIIDSQLPTVAVFAKKEDQTETSEPNVAPEGKEANSLSEPLSELSESKKEVLPAAAESESNSEQDYSKGVVFYMKNEMIVGIVLWNVFNKIHTARQVLAERKKYDDLNEVAKLFNIHETN